MKTKSTPPKRKPQPDGEATVLLRHEFTKDERLDLSRRQNAALNRIGELESQLASVRKDFMAKIQAEDLIVKSLGHHLNSGYEMRPTRVVVEFHAPESKKFFFALDDKRKKHKLGEEAMNAADYEMRFQFDSPAPAPAVPVTAVTVTATPCQGITIGPVQSSPLGLEDQAIEVIRAEGKCSATLIMRRLKLEFGEADSLMESLQAKGIVGPATGSKGQREILALPEPK